MITIMIMCGLSVLTDAESEAKFKCQSHDFLLIYNTSLLSKARSDPLVWKLERVEG